MVSVSTTIAAAVVGVIAAATSSEALPSSMYYRPAAAVVTGMPDNTSAEYRRSPCPAINTLANHGFLPRDGRSITKTMLKDAVMEKYNLDDALATRLTGPLPDKFDLNLLGTHGFVEHDASIAHADWYLGADPSAVDQGLLADFLSRADSSKPFTVETMGQIRQERLATCMAKNPDCTFTTKDATLSFGEATLVLLGFGDATTATADYAAVKSFFEEERFPDDFTPKAVITTELLTATSAKIAAIAAAGAAATTAPAVANATIPSASGSAAGSVGTIVPSTGSTAGSVTLPSTGSTAGSIPAPSVTVPSTDSEAGSSADNEQEISA